MRTTISLNTCGLSGFDDRARIDLRLQARDVFLDRRVQERQTPRQVSDVLAEIRIRPLREFRIVEPDAAAKGRPDTGQGARKRRLASTA